VFWGAVFVFVDVWFGMGTDGRIARVDLLPNLVGFGLLAIGTGQLAFGYGLKGNAESIMTAVMAVTASFFVGSLVSLFYPRVTDLELWARVTFTFVGGATIAGFCFVMHGISRDLGLEDLGERWTLVAVLFLLRFLAPNLAMFHIPGLSDQLVYWVVMTSLNLASLTYLLLVLYRMKKSAEAAANAGRRTRGAA